MSDEVVLEMKNVSKSFGGVQALRSVGFQLKQSEIVALMGENGAGKSTLMNILNGSFTDYEGEIRIRGQNVTLHSPLDASKLGIAKIHQELQLIPELTIAENIFLGREPINALRLVDYAKMREQASVFLDALELKLKPSTPVYTLRVGEQQLVEIAKALSLQANILIMDEPTSALSNAEAQKLFQVMRKLVAEGVSIIYISHRIDEIFELSDRITVMRDGTYIGTENTAETSEEQLVRMMVGRNLSEMFPARETKLGAELLRVEELCFDPPRGSSKKALKEISFNLRRGEVLGIAGLMGAGRSELFECLFGLHDRSLQGRVWIKGKRVRVTHPLKAIHSGLAFVTEDRKGQGLVLGGSITENMTFPLLKLISSLTFIRSRLERKLAQQQVDNLKIKASGLNVTAGQLSGGNQQKVVLGRWLLTEPDILLLDEPTRGIDVGAKAQIYSLINSLASEGKGIILISSELSELLGLSDRILTLCEGRLTGEFTREEATQEKLLASATSRKR
jgi:ABC-type sugar transport system ATPase subunit